MQWQFIDGYTNLTNSNETNNLIHKNLTSGINEGKTRKFFISFISTKTDFKRIYRQVETKVCRMVIEQKSLEIENFGIISKYPKFREFAIK